MSNFMSNLFRSNKKLTIDQLIVKKTIISFFSCFFFWWMYLGLEMAAPAAVGQ